MAALDIAANGIANSSGLLIAGTQMLKNLRLADYAENRTPGCVPLKIEFIRQTFIKKEYARSKSEKSVSQSL